MRGAVLAGGIASRYAGQPKGLLPVGGRRILDRVVDAIRTATGAAPLLVANDPGAPDWRPDLECMPDLIRGAGSLGGILTAVAAGPGPVLCVAWDMPFVPAALLETLVREGGGDSCDALLPVSGSPRGGGLEPLCAVYGPACRGPIEAAIARGDYRAVAFHDAVRVGTLSLDRTRAFGDPDELFFNVNRPEDLERAEGLWRRRG